MSTQGCWEKRLQAWEIHKSSLPQMVGVAGIEVKQIAL